jgi:hypothetical protein
VAVTMDAFPPAAPTLLYLLKLLPGLLSDEAGKSCFDELTEMS